MASHWGKVRGVKRGRAKRKAQRAHKEARMLKARENGGGNLLERAGVTPAPLDKALRAIRFGFLYGMNVRPRRFADVVAQPAPTREEMTAIMDRYFAAFPTTLDWLEDMPKVSRPYYMHPTTFARHYMTAGRLYTELAPNVYRIDDASSPYVIETHKGVKIDYATTERPENVGSIQTDAGGTAASREQSSGGS